MLRDKHSRHNYVTNCADRRVVRTWLTFVYTFIAAARYTILALCILPQKQKIDKKTTNLSESHNIYKINASGVIDDHREIDVGSSKFIRC